MVWIANKKLYISIVACLYFLLRFLNCFFPTSIYFIAFFTLVEALSLLLLPLNARIAVKPIPILLGFLIVSCLGASMFIRKEFFVSETVFTILGIFLGYYLSIYGLERKAAYGLFVIISIVMLYRMIITGSVNQVFVVTSRNSISSFIIMAAVLIYSSVDDNDKNDLPLLPALIAFLFSCLGEGRGGVISSFVLLGGVIFINMVVHRRFTLKRALLFFAFAVAAWVIISKYYDVFFTRAAARLSSQKFSSNERIGIISEYWYAIRRSPIYALIGLPRSVIPAVAYLNGNFHNSYLALHSTFGIAGFAAVFCVIIKAVRCTVCTKRWAALLLLGVVLLRMLTDDLCFVGLYDPLFYYMVSRCLHNEKGVLPKQFVEARI